MKANIAYNLVNLSKMYYGHPTNARSSFFIFRKLKILIGQIFCGLYFSPFRFL